MKIIRLNPRISVISIFSVRPSVILRVAIFVFEISTRVIVFRLHLLEVRDRWTPIIFPNCAQSYDSFHKWKPVISIQLYDLYLQISSGPTTVKPPRSSRSSRREKKPLSLPSGCYYFTVILLAVKCEVCFFNPTTHMDRLNV